MKNIYLIIVILLMNFKCECQNTNELDKFNGFKTFKLGSEYKIHASNLKYTNTENGIKYYDYKNPELIEFQKSKPKAVTFGFYNNKLYDIMMFFDDYNEMVYKRIYDELIILFGEPTENRKTIIENIWVSWEGKNVSLMTQYFVKGDNFCIEFQSKNIKRLVLRKNILETKPKDATYYYNRGVEKEKEKDNTGAIADFTKAIEINPKYSSAYLERANAKGNLEDFRGAITDYSKAIKFDPKNYKAYYNRGLAKIILGQKDDGCIDLSKAGELGYDGAYETIKKYCQ